MRGTRWYGLLVLLLLLAVALAGGAQAESAAVTTALELAEQVKNARNEAVVTLGGDIDCAGETLANTRGASVTLELNGHTLSGAAFERGDFTVRGGTLADFTLPAKKTLTLRLASGLRAVINDPAGTREDLAWLTAASGAKVEFANEGALEAARPLCATGSNAKITLRNSGAITLTCDGGPRITQEQARAQYDEENPDRAEELAYYGYTEEEIEEEIRSAVEEKVEASRPILLSFSLEKGSLTAENSGQITSGAKAIAVSAKNAPLNLVNSGTIESAEDGVEFSGEGKSAKATVENSGVIAAGKEGFSLFSKEGVLDLRNSGTITGSLASFLQSSANITLENSGEIAGEMAGVYIYSPTNSGKVTVVNTGAISGVQTAGLLLRSLFKGTARVENSGTVSGDTALFLRGGDYGKASFTLENTGTFTGVSAGLKILVGNAEAQSAVTVKNEGVISAPGGVGLYTYEGYNAKSIALKITGGGAVSGACGVALTSINPDESMWKAQIDQRIAAARTQNTQALASGNLAAENGTAVYCDADSLTLKGTLTADGALVHPAIDLGDLPAWKITATAEGAVDYLDAGLALFGVQKNFNEKQAHKQLLAKLKKLSAAAFLKAGGRVRAYISAPAPDAQGKPQFSILRNEQLRVGYAGYYTAEGLTLQEGLASEIKSPEAPSAVPAQEAGQRLADALSHLDAGITLLVDCDVSEARGGAQRTDKKKTLTAVGGGHTVDGLDLIQGNFTLEDFALLRGVVTQEAVALTVRRSVIENMRCRGGSLTLEGAMVRRMGDSGHALDFDQGELTIDGESVVEELSAGDGKIKNDGVINSLAIYMINDKESVTLRGDGTLGSAYLQYHGNKNCSITVDQQRIRSLTALPGENGKLTVKGDIEGDVILRPGSAKFSVTLSGTLGGALTLEVPEGALAEGADEKAAAKLAKTYAGKVTFKNLKDENGETAVLRVLLPRWEVTFSSAKKLLACEPAAYTEREDIEFYDEQGNRHWVTTESIYQAGALIGVTREEYVYSPEGDRISSETSRETYDAQGAVTRREVFAAQAQQPLPDGGSLVLSTNHVYDGDALLYREASEEIKDAAGAPVSQTVQQYDANGTLRQQFEYLFETLGEGYYGGTPVNFRYFDENGQPVELSGGYWHFWESGGQDAGE